MFGRCAPQEKPTQGMQKFVVLVEPVIRAPLAITRAKWQ